MINKKPRHISEVSVLQNDYYHPSEINFKNFLNDELCKGCHKMSRVTMSCYAAAKHNADRDETVARMQSKDKPRTSRNTNKYEEMATSIALDKYNGKLMNSIWGLYNRNSPHNFKKQNAEGMMSSKGQEMASTGTQYKSSSFVHISIPQFSGIVSVETTMEVKKPKTSLEKFENLFSLPIF